MNKEQQTITAIQKAVPEILKRELDIQKILEKYFVVLDGRDNDSANDIIIELSRKLNKITLEDVLVAINGKGDDLVENMIPRQRGGAYYYYIEEAYSDVLKYWQFNKPLTEQTQQTKKLIGDLILKK